MTTTRASRRELAASLLNGSDPDPEETREWLDSLDALVSGKGAERTGQILARVLGRARTQGIVLLDELTTDYRNTIPVEVEPPFPGDEALETRIRHFVRWNAAVMVTRANHRADGIGGHLATYASAATLYEVGFNHFFHGADRSSPGDQVFFQGHAAPGLYARAYLEGRLSEAALDGFRREVTGGLPSYPHPRRSEFWQFPTVSMGLGPISAAYQARFNRYLADREIADTSASKVWCFVGDGEMDEPESLAAVALAGRDEYLLERRRALGGSLPRRVVHPHALRLPEADAYQELESGTGEKVPASTTGAFTRLLRNLLRDPEIGRRVVPIIPDEARTFGIDGLFREVKIYASGGQRYVPVDAGLLLSYQEASDGQILEEGITEAGSMASFLAAGTAYATWGEPTIPFFVYYSMFGFHRFGDLLWAAGGARARGFLLAATAGRTTLQGEGLQHCDGHSLLFASAIPNLRAYDPAFAYEVAVIVRDGLRRMYGPAPEDLLYYLTLYNEPYVQPPMPPGVEEGIVASLYRYREAAARCEVRILASGPAMLAALEAQRDLHERYQIDAEVWSATSYKALRDEALSIERWNRLHPDEEQRVSYVERVLGEDRSPVVAVTDHIKLVPDQIARFVRAPFCSLGTDGFGLSDTRAALRRHFETDAAHVVVAALSSLAREGTVEASTVVDAERWCGIDPDAPDPRET